MKNHLVMRILSRSTVFVLIGALLPQVISQEPAHGVAQFYKRTDAYAYAATGLMEPYKAYQLSWWYDNNSWDARNNQGRDGADKSDGASTLEGADCSGYVVKSWAVGNTHGGPSTNGYTRENQPFHGGSNYGYNDYNTETFWRNPTKDDKWGEREWNYTNSINYVNTLDVIVWPHERRDGLWGHIVIVRSLDNQGKIVTWEGEGSRPGIRENSARSLSFFSDRSKTCYRCNSVMSRMQYRQRMWYETNFE